MYIYIYIHVHICVNNYLYTYIFTSAPFHVACVKAAPSTNLREGECYQCARKSLVALAWLPVACVEGSASTNLREGKRILDKCAQNSVLALVRTTAMTTAAGAATCGATSAATGAATSATMGAVTVDNDWLVEGHVFIGARLRRAGVKGVRICIRHHVVERPRLSHTLHTRREVMDDCDTPRISHLRPYTYEIPCCRMHTTF